MRNGLEVLVSVVDQATGPLKKILNGVEDIQGVGSRLQSVGMAARDLGAGMVSLGRPVLSAGAGAIQTAANFESSMNRVRSITGAVGNDFEALRDSAMEMGATTQFSASESAEAQQYLGMAGFKTNEIIGALPHTLDLAAAGMLDLGRAADISSNILSGMNLQVDDLAHVNDVLAHTASNSNVSIEMLGEAFSYVGPDAVAAGQSIHQMSAAMGILGDAGIQGSRGGTVLRRALIQLLNPAAKGEAVLDRLGISVKELGEDGTESMRPLNEIIQDLSDSGANFSDILDIFGAEASGGIQALMARSEEFTEFVMSLDDVDGAVREMAEINMEGFNGQLTKLGSAFEGLQLAIADTGLQDAATKFLEFLTDLISKVSDADKGVLSFTVGFVGLGSALLVTSGAALMFAGGLAATAGTLTTTFGAGGALAFATPALMGLATVLGGLASVLIGVTGGLAAIVVGAFLLPAAFIKVLAHLQGVKLTWGEIFGTMGQILGDFRHNILQVPEAVGGAFEAMKNVATSRVNEFISPFTDRLSQLPGAIGGAFDAMKNKTMLRLSEWVSGAREKALEFITKIIDRLSQLPGAIGGALAAMKNITMLNLNLWVSGAREKAQEFITKITDRLSQLPGAISGVLAAMKNITMLNLNLWVSEAREKAQEFITKIVDRLSQLPGAITGALAAMKNITMLNLNLWVSGAREKALEFITKIVDGVRSGISQVVSAVTSLKDRALGALAGWGSSAYNKGVEFVNSIASGIRNAIGGLRSAVDEAAGVAAGAWPQSPPKWGPLSNIMDYGGNIMTSIASGITSAPIASAMRKALIPTQQQLTPAPIAMRKVLVPTQQQLIPAPLASAMRQALIPTQQQLTPGGGTAGTTTGGGTTSINFAPTINAAPGTDIAAIESVLRDQLEILLERIDRDKNRVSYG